MPPRVRVSTNSLAATDAFFVYALSHKYKRLYLRRLGFRIHEWKPHPADAPRVLAGLDFLRGPLAVAPPGPRLGMHAKTLVVDRRLVLIGSHNFTPRSADLNTENGVLIEDADFAALVLAEIERDLAGENAWRIARRERLPLLGWLSAQTRRALRGAPDLRSLALALRHQLREAARLPGARARGRGLPTLLPGGRRLPGGAAAAQAPAHAAGHRLRPRARADPLSRACPRGLRGGRLAAGLCRSLAHEPQAPLRSRRAGSRPSARARPGRGRGPRAARRARGHRLGASQPRRRARRRIPRTSSASGSTGWSG
ncbi:MAG: phospholipase D-like domain-containing protein [Xanthomonadales bacterium]|nr:phospholipase D-like domain-containing protein [Xanthomonadales bacterium]